MPVIKNATCYNMDHEYRGIAVIINNDIFESTTGLGPRIGSWKDVEELKTMFYRLDFTVVVWNNLFQSQLLKYLSERMYFTFKMLLFIFYNYILFYSNSRKSY